MKNEDSGCSNHMTGDEKQFRDMDRTIKSQVKLGNGELVDVEGKGTIARLIKDVLLVPKLDANLPSVGQMMEKGYSLIFKGDSCTIYDNKNKDKDAETEELSTLLAIRRSRTKSSGRSIMAMAPKVRAFQSTWVEDTSPEKYDERSSTHPTK